MTTYIIDTHALVWYLAGDARLGAQAEAILDDPNVQPIIPAIVLAEIKHLAYRGRFAQTLDETLQVIQADPRCLVYPIDVDFVAL